MDRRRYSRAPIKPFTYRYMYAATADEGGTGGQVRSDAKGGRAKSGNSIVSFTRAERSSL
jgi:hypothetical protein